MSKKKAKEVFVRLGGNGIVVTKEDFENDNYGTDCSYYFVRYEDANGNECEEDGTYLNQNKMNRIFKSSGMLWDDGDIPKCDYCTKDFDNVESLCETPISGGLVCEDQECRDALLRDILYDEVKEETK